MQLNLLVVTYCHKNYVTGCGWSLKHYRQNQEMKRVSSCDTISISPTSKFLCVKN